MDQSNPQNRNYEVQARRSKTERTVLSAEESRQAITTGRNRWILAISLGLAVIAMVVVYAMYA